MKLYGSTTSPFVRRARVVAFEAGLVPEFVLTSTDAGTAALRAIAPIRKVPVAEIDGRVLFDSRAIAEWITTTRGWGRLAPPRDRFAELNHLNAVDAALESQIEVFYLEREGVDVRALPLAERQRDRTRVIFAWLLAEHAAGRFGAELGFAALSLRCALDWMRFRNRWPLAELDAFEPIVGRFDAWESVRSTAPHV